MICLTKKCFFCSLCFFVACFTVNLLWLSSTLHWSAFEVGEENRWNPEICLTLTCTHKYRFKYKYRYKYRYKTYRNNKSANLGLNASGSESEEGEGGGRPVVLLVRTNLFRLVFSIRQEYFWARDLRQNQFIKYGQENG